MASTILAGDYTGIICYHHKKGIYIDNKKTFKHKLTYVNKDTVEKYEVVNEEVSKSMTDGVVKGAVGGALLGPIGALAGVTSGGNKGLYTTSISFKDGTRCLCDLDNDMYKKLLAAMY
jgi:hypothetical protein